MQASHVFAYYKIKQIIKTSKNPKETSYWDENNKSVDVLTLFLIVWFSSLFDDLALLFCEAAEAEPYN